MLADVEPSISIATRSSASSAVERQAASCAAVFATNRRLTALLLVPRTQTSAPVGSKLDVLSRGDADDICSTTAFRWSFGERENSAGRFLLPPHVPAAGESALFGRRGRPRW